MNRNTWPIAVADQHGHDERRQPAREVGGAPLHHGRLARSASAWYSDRTNSMPMLSSERTTFRPLQRYEQVAERLAADIRSGLLRARRAAAVRARPRAHARGQPRLGAGGDRVAAGPGRRGDAQGRRHVRRRAAAARPTVAARRQPLGGARGPRAARARRRAARRRPRPARHRRREPARRDGGRAGRHRHLERLRPALPPPARGHDRQPGPARVRRPRRRADGPAAVAAAARRLDRRRPAARASTSPSTA